MKTIKIFGDDLKIKSDKRMKNGYKASHGYKNVSQWLWFTTMTKDEIENQMVVK